MRFDEKDYDQKPSPLTFLMDIPEFLLKAT
jgi:hypothetical protein